MECKGTSRKATYMARLRSGAGLIRLFRTSDDGATMVEMALSSAILFAGVFGIIMMSFALYTYDYIAEAAHEGARYAIVRGAYCVGFSDCPDVTGDQISTYVKSINYPGINPSHLTVSTSWYNVVQGVSGTNTTITLCGTAPAGCDVPLYNSVQVQVTYDFPLNIPFYTSTNLHMSSTAQLPISQ